MIETRLSRPRTVRQRSEEFGVQVLCSRRPRVARARNFRTHRPCERLGYKFEGVEEGSRMMR